MLRQPNGGLLEENFHSGDPANVVGHHQLLNPSNIITGAAAMHHHYQNNHNQFVNVAHHHTHQQQHRLPPTISNPADNSTLAHHQPQQQQPQQAHHHHQSQHHQQHHPMHQHYPQLSIAIAGHQQQPIPQNQNQSVVAALNFVDQKSTWTNQQQHVQQQQAAASAFVHQQQLTHALTSPSLASPTSPTDLNSPVSTTASSVFAPSQASLQHLLHQRHQQQQQQSQQLHLHQPSSQSVHTPTSSDACASIVHSLMCHRQGGDEDFSRRAIESLIKKLKDKREELDALIQGITTAGVHATRCVTIQRTLDGRLQVAGRKGFPHVVYARIWRWPDLHKNELKHIKICEYAFDLKRDLLCVNPYHYERVVSPGIGNIDFERLKLDGEANESTGVKSEYAETCVENELSPTVNVLASSSSQISPRDVVDGTGQASWNVGRLSSQSGASSSLYDASGVNSQLDNQWSQELSPTLSSQGSYQTQRQDSIGGMHQMQQQGLYGSAIGASTWNSGNMSASASLGPTTSRPSMASLFMSRQSDEGDTSTPLSTQPLPEFWCTVAYYELDSQVGETFKVPSIHKSVTVDGYVDPSAVDRFCLGALSNVHRTAGSEKARLHIGRGVRLELKGEGDVVLCVESDQSIFVQSYYLDHVAGRPLGAAVHKFTQKDKMKVFDLRQCHRQMLKQVADAQAGIAATAAAVAGIVCDSGVSIQGPKPAAGIGVDDLRKLCYLRLSFVKGWGPNYPKKNIKETPCWIEVHLNRALQLLDEVLHSMST